MEKNLAHQKEMLLLAMNQRKQSSLRVLQSSQLQVLLRR